MNLLNQKGVQGSLPANKVAFGAERDMGHDSPVRPVPSFSRFFKRLGDIVFSLTALILFAPLFFFIALAIKLSSRGPAFHKYKAIMSDGTSYVAWKFRTIRCNLGEIKCKHIISQVDSPHIQINDSPPITSVGRFLQETQLDKIPMLINVLGGDASLFGTETLPKSGILSKFDKKLDSERKTEKFLQCVSYWIPRKQREGLVGDIMEDCRELRALGKREWRIRIHVVWQLVIALIMLRPSAFMDALKRMWSTK